VTRFSRGFQSCPTAYEYIFITYYVLIYTYPNVRRILHVRTLVKAALIRIVGCRKARCVRSIRSRLRTQNGKVKAFERRVLDGMKM
jgi:hypothetical protein